MTVELVSQHSQHPNTTVELVSQHSSWISVPTQHMTRCLHTIVWSVCHTTDLHTTDLYTTDLHTTDDSVSINSCWVKCLHTTVVTSAYTTDGQQMGKHKGQMSLPNNWAGVSTKRFSWYFRTTHGSTHCLHTTYGSTHCLHTTDGSNQHTS